MPPGSACTSIVTHLKSTIVDQDGINNEDQRLRLSEVPLGLSVTISNI